MSIADNIKRLKKETDTIKVQLIAVSKTKPEEEIMEAYNAGQRVFGENMVQELVEKYEQLPKNIQWHLIGHLQSNKVKYIAPFVQLIHAVDSFKLLLEINKQAAKNNRTIDVLLQMHIASEETKFGMDEKEIIELLDYYTAQQADLKNIRICGLMGMATNTDNTHQIRAEFDRLHIVFKNLSKSYFLAKQYFSIMSIGMSSDYEMAIAAGGNMVRIGSLLFGERNYA